MIRYSSHARLVSRDTCPCVDTLNQGETFHRCALQCLAATHPISDHDNAPRGTAVREFTRRGAALISKLPDTHVNHVTRACFLWMRVIPQLIACTVSNRSTPILLFIEESYFSNFFNQKATPNWKLFAFPVHRRESLWGMYGDSRILRSVQWRRTLNVIVTGDKSRFRERKSFERSFENYWTGV